LLFTIWNENEGCFAIIALRHGHQIGGGEALGQQVGCAFSNFWGNGLVHHDVGKRHMGDNIQNIHLFHRAGSFCNLW